MSLSGLQSFLGGAEPYAKSRKRLAAWHTERGERLKRVREGAVRSEDIDLAVSILGHYIKSDGRPDARARMLREITSKLADEGGVTTEPPPRKSKVSRTKKKRDAEEPDGR